MNIETAKSLVALIRERNPHDDRKFKLTDSEAAWLIYTELKSSFENGCRITARLAS